MLTTSLRAWKTSGMFYAGTREESSDEGLVMKILGINENEILVCFVPLLHRRKYKIHETTRGWNS